jgi:hypothetical protein
MIQKTLVAAAALASSASFAAPSVFIPGGDAAWWTADNAQGRVIGTTSGTVTGAKLGEFIEATEIYSPYKVCSLTPVANDTFVGLDKEKQDEINQTVRGMPWRLEGVAPGGRLFVAQSVLYEACDDTENRGGAVLVTDAQTGEIMMFQRMGVFTSNRSPIWTAFLSSPSREDKDPPLFSYSHCTECGAETHIYYDVSRKKLYTEYNGH